MKKKMLYGTMPVLAVLFALSAVSCATRPKWKDLSFRGEAAPLLAGTVWMDEDDDGASWLFSPGGEWLYSDPTAFYTYMQERHGTWERTGNTVKMVEDNGYVYWECTYYPERNQIAGRYYSNHKKPDGDITLIPYNEEVARSLQAEERARLAAMSAKNAEEAQRWKWLDSLSQGLQGASGALSQTLLQVPGTNQGQTGTTQIQQTAISLAGTNWRANLGQGKTETIYFSNGTWVSVSGSDSVAGTYTYNGSTVTLKTSTGGAVGSGTVSGTTLSMFGNQYTKQ